MSDGALFDSGVRVAETQRWATTWPVTSVSAVNGRVVKQASCGDSRVPRALYEMVVSGVLEGAEGSMVEFG